MSNYDEALKLSNVDPTEWTEPVLLKANVLATLALADELRATREDAGPVVAPEPSEGSMFVYVLTRTFDDTGKTETMSVYTDQDRIRREVQDLNTMSVTQRAGVTWNYRPYILNKGE